MPKNNTKKKGKGQREYRVVVRGRRRAEPDIARIARAVIGLSMAETTKLQTDAVAPVADGGEEVA